MSAAVADDVAAPRRPPTPLRKEIRARAGGGVGGGGGAGGGDDFDQDRRVEARPPPIGTSLDRHRAATEAAAPRLGWQQEQGEPEETEGPEEQAVLGDDGHQAAAGAAAGAAAPKRAWWSTTSEGPPTEAEPDDGSDPYEGSVVEVCEKLLSQVYYRQNMYIAAAEVYDGRDFVRFIVPGTAVLGLSE